jgi:hypothetical protein
VFGLQLPFYASKPLYLWLGRALTCAGVSLVRAPYVLSLLSFVLICALLPLLSMRAGAPSGLALGVGVLGPCLPPLREVGSLARPDALATALLVAGTTVSLSSQRAALAFLSGAVLARPDMAILAIGVLGGTAQRETAGTARRDLVALSATLCAVAVGVVALADSYDWSTFMRHTFVARLVNFDDVHRSFGVGDYFNALGRGLRGHMVSQPAVIVPFAALTALSWRAYAKAAQPEGLRLAARMLTAIWIASALRFLAIPILADRFFAAAYVLTLALSPVLIARSGLLHRLASGYRGLRSGTSGR